MYNIVRHLVEGREGIETFNLSKTEHLNAYANQIRTSSFSVCCVFAVCMCVCLLFPQLWLWFRLLLFSFSFSFSHSVRVRVHVRARVLRQLDTRSSPSSSLLLVPFPSRVFSILFYFSVASFVHFKLQFSSVFFVFVVFLFCVFVYTAEFLPIISPLRECTKRPSNSMVEFCLMLPVGVRRGSFSSLNKRK